MNESDGEKEKKSTYEVVEGNGEEIGNLVSEVRDELEEFLFGGVRHGIGES